VTLHENVIIDMGNLTEKECSKIMPENSDLFNPYRPKYCGLLEKAKSNLLEYRIK